MSAGVSAAALRLSALTAGGAVAAVVVGTLVFAGGGAGGVAALLFFFVTGSLLTRLRRRRQGKGPSGRRARQVLANGLPAAAAGLAQWLAGAHPGWQAMLAGSLAAMAADTWATEVGLMSGAPTRLAFTRRPVAPGTSGGVSLPGTLAAVAGAAATAYLGAGAGAALGRGVPAHGPAIWGSAGGWAVAALAGVGGMVLDSLLGAYVQARYRCRACGEMVENPGEHRRQCPGAVLDRVAGIQGVDNDVVNALAAWAAGLAAMGWTSWLG